MSQMPPLADRILSLKKEEQDFKPGICTQRAVIWTEYFKNHENRSKPVCIQIAEAFREVLLRKTIQIYPGELIVGQPSSETRLPLAGRTQTEITRLIGIDLWRSLHAAYNR
jgi:hypothetical protein